MRMLVYLKMRPKCLNALQASSDHESVGRMLHPDLVLGAVEGLLRGSSGCPCTFCDLSNVVRNAAWKRMGIIIY